MMWDFKDKVLPRITLDPREGEAEELSEVGEKLSALESVDLNLTVLFKENLTKTRI